MGPKIPNLGDRMRGRLAKAFEIAEHPLELPVLHREPELDHRESAAMRAKSGLNNSRRERTISGQRKSFQRQTTEKIASTASAGAVSGKIMRQ